ncbi:MAG: hypothetical protein FWD17_18975 [Polyangiaceae bacterium]|nr:hypothetical protein [Polyangiaceae bacterium]
MIQLVIAGTDSRVVASACSACPHSPAGCCAGPPRFDWSDIGRVVARGGLEWLIREIAMGSVAPTAGGLAIRERRGLARRSGPRMAKCAFHGVDGCTLAPEQRPATCNYFLCEPALAAVGPAQRAEASRARALQTDLAERFARWDALLDAEVTARWPGGAPFDRAFLVWLGARFEELTA